MSHQLDLLLYTEQFSVLKFASGAKVPKLIDDLPFYSITRTPEELSIVTLQPSSEVMQELLEKDGMVAYENDWRCMKVQGPLDFSLIGILSNLSTTLAQAKISIFAISTYDTDYLLVKQSTVDRAKEELEKVGHTITIKSIF
ncbi:hypothetical protein K493DRAFT_305396 [Basidiobolus meristosporus CBS 931.73]|uniref:Uncharacterized protein n=1 Tax=Basidiobolus meristosporus CBS 931.73 TaxID=1314790 RepID=A0A1Y1W3W4_9FUNG|nr:hypothetical protein K493DRAFT_294360 [Basidiobolus meristosporus CBS 931.73]ORX89862.1 hypothetical protein K493DRAFT_305396 [Basidiobolus meristosporus CBS 931.73]|eukprot:ORX68062.1 hypothetical protein K493DRAFT_294360 [Basidiobolus meristosporus CBS 931.73]